MMGPDCGTARIDGIGLGFANRGAQGQDWNRRRLGHGVADGDGRYPPTWPRRVAGVWDGWPRPVSRSAGEVGETCSGTAEEDAETDVIVVVSKPPAAAVARDLWAEAASCDKPTVINFIGYGSPQEQLPTAPSIHFARTLDETAEVAVRLTTSADSQSGVESDALPSRAMDTLSRLVQSPQPHTFLRGLYSGGTLAYEALFLLQDSLPSVRSNGPLPGGEFLDNPHHSQGHTVVDLGGDAFTVGRLHPMLDNDLRVRRLLQEAQDPGTGLIVLDVVLGDGAHADPAGELAPAIEEAVSVAAQKGRALPVVAVVIGTDCDPQGLDRQVEQLKAAGAYVFTRHDDAMRAVACAFAGGQRRTATQPVRVGIRRPDRDGGREQLLGIRGHKCWS